MVLLRLVKVTHTRYSSVQQL